MRKQFIILKKGGGQHGRSVSPHVHAHHAFATEATRFLHSLPSTHSAWIIQLAKRFGFFFRKFAKFETCFFFFVQEGKSCNMTQGVVALSLSFFFFTGHGHSTINRRYIFFLLMRPVAFSRSPRSRFRALKFGQVQVHVAMSNQHICKRGEKEKKKEANPTKIAISPSPSSAFRSRGFHVIVRIKVTLPARLLVPG